MMQENNTAPTLNQDIYRRILKLIILRKNNDLTDVMKQHAGKWVFNLIYFLKLKVETECVV